jgi:sulfur carrier protein
LKVVIKLFASLRVGRFKTEEQNLPEGTTLQELFKLLELQLIDVAIARVNGKMADDDYILQAGDQVALFPPLGGG